MRFLLGNAGGFDAGGAGRASPPTWRRSTAGCSPARSGWWPRSPPRWRRSSSTACTSWSTSSASTTCRRSTWTCRRTCCTATPPTRRAAAAPRRRWPRWPTPSCGSSRRSSSTRPRRSGVTCPARRRRAGTQRPPGRAGRRSTPNVLDEDLLAKWDWLQEVRRDAYAVLEVFRQRGRFDKHTEARVALVVADAAELARLREVGAQRAGRPAAGERTGAGDARRGQGRSPATRSPATRWASSGSPPATLLEQTYKRCERCWNYRPTVGAGPSPPTCATAAVRL